jgi:hypothetical protein
MKIFAASLLLCMFAGPEPPEPSISYFTNVRNVSVTQPDKQNYFVVDNDIWVYARPDLGDLRLYDGTSQVQYSISEQRASVTSEQAAARILNLGSVSGHTEFDLDMAGVTEFDRVLLALDAKDFVVSASVAGMSSPGESSSTELPPSTLYDFTREKLGSNFTIKLPPSSFRYLHVKLSAGLRPQQIKAASIYNVHEQKAVWVPAGSCGAPQQKEHETVIECDLPEKVPVNRIQFQVDPSEVNFLRTVKAEDAKGRQLGAGDISRVRVTRAGSTVIDEKLDVDLSSNSGRLTLTVDNGDNHPLTILAVQPLSFERRVYFDPQGKSALRLYYGDVKLSAPVYDYARFFHQDASGAKAELGPAGHNAEYAGRPDERPWSEQHKGVLWTIMIVAVMVLAALAIRGLRAPAQRVG